MKPTNSLGDKLRKSKFDPDLAARVNREVELEERRAALQSRKAAVREPVPTSQPATAVSVPSNAELRSLLVDPVSPDNGYVRSQEDWITYWGGITDGRVMASMKDLYHCFKQLKVYSEHGTAQQKAAAAAIVTSFRDDFDWSGKKNWLISGTRHFYDPTTESTRITHHYNCSQRGLILSIGLRVPVYLGSIITSVVGDKLGLEYLQAEFDTNDNGNVIIGALEFISGNNRNDIKVWTPPIKEGTSGTTRVRSPVRASGFYHYNGEFLVNCDGAIYINGRSRGVRL